MENRAQATAGSQSNLGHQVRFAILVPQSGGAPQTARWMRFQHCQVGYQIQAMPFGWNLSSLWSHLMSQPIKAKLHQMGIQLAWFVDDILILGTSAKISSTKRLRQSILGTQTEHQQMLTKSEVTKWYIWAKGSIWIQIQSQRRRKNGMQLKEL